MYIHTKICTQMPIPTLFIVAKSWKQLRYPSIGEYIMQPWDIQTMGYYSALKRNDLSARKRHS